MTIPAPSVAAVYAYLLDAIPAQFPADSGIGMYLGDPGNEPELQFVQITDVRMAWSPATMIGSGGEDWLKEGFSVNVKVAAAGAVANFTTDPLVIVDQAWQLVTYVVTAVREDPGLGGLALVAYPQAAIGGAPVACNIGRKSELIVPIAIEQLN
jgi:hypothetical protein